MHAVKLEVDFFEVLHVAYMLQCSNSLFCKTFLLQTSNSIFFWNLQDSKLEFMYFWFDTQFQIFVRILFFKTQNWLFVKFACSTSQIWHFVKLAYNETCFLIYCKTESLSYICYTKYKFVTAAKAVHNKYSNTSKSMLIQSINNIINECRHIITTTIYIPNHVSTTKL